MKSYLIAFKILKDQEKNRFHQIFVLKVKDIPLSLRKQNPDDIIRFILFNMTLVIRIDQLTLKPHQSSMVRDPSQSLYSLVITNKEWQTSDTFPSLKPTNHLLMMGAKSTLIFQVYLEDCLKSYATLRGDQLVRKYEDKFPRKRNQKIQATQRINLREEGHDLQVSFTYKFDGLKVITGYMEKILDPQRIKPVDKFFNQIPSCSTQSQVNLQIQEEFIEMPESMNSKLKKRIQFYKANCQRKNLFSFMDARVKNEKFSFIEPKY